MKTAEKLSYVNGHRDRLSHGQRRALGGFKSMFRNIAEEGGRIGGESHVSPNGLKQCEAFLDKCITIIQ